MRVWNVSSFMVLFFCLVQAANAFATGELAQTFTLDGQLTKAGSELPLLDAHAKIVVQILDPSKTCLLYEEQQYVDTTTSNGYYNIQVGSDTGATKRTSNDPGRTMVQIYQNSSAINAASVPGQTCSGGAYTPAPEDVRYFRLIVTPSSTNTADTLSPDTPMDSVATALVAQTLQGLPASQFLQIGTGDLTQTNLQSVFASGNAAKLNTLLSVNPSIYVTRDATNGTILIPTESSPASPQAGQIWYDSGALKYYNGTTTQTLGTSSGVTSVTAGTGLNVGAGPNGMITSTGTLNVDVGTNAGQIVQVQTGGKLPALDGSNLTGLSGTAIQSGTIGGTTAVSTSGNIQTSGDMTAKRLFLQDGASNFVGLKAPATVTSTYSLTFPAAQGGANTVLQNDGSGNLSWVAANAGTVTSVSVTAPVTAGGTASAPIIGITKADSTHDGYLASTDWNTFNGKQSTSLTAANIWVGNASNVATAVAPSGDLTMTNAGAFTVAKIQGTGVSATAPTGAGQVLRYDGSVWKPNFVAMTDLRSSVTGNSQFGTVCTSGQTLTFNSVADTMACANITVDGSNFSSQTAGTFLAAPSATAGTPSFRSIALADLPTSGLVLNNGQAGAVTLGPSDSNPLTLDTAGAARLTIDASGNVGIGTTNPGGLLAVGSSSQMKVDSSGNLTANSFGQNTGGGANVLNNLLYIELSDGTTYSSSSSSSAYPTSTSALNLANTGATSGTISEILLTGNAGNSSYIASIQPSSGHTPALVFGQQTGASAYSERMRIAENGYLGIGTTAPATALDVNGAFSLRGISAPSVSSAGQGRIYFDSTSNQFMVSQNAGSYVALATTGGTTNGLNSTATETFNSNSDGSGSDGGFNFQSGGSNLLTIANNGDSSFSSTTASSSSSTGSVKVAGGLGVAGDIYSGATVNAATSMTTPQIYGSSSSSGTLKLDGTSNATKGYVLINSAGGNVGIGTTAPAGVLDVEGGTAAAGNAGADIVLAAQNAGTGAQNGGNIVLNSGMSSGVGTASGTYQLGTTFNLQTSGTYKSIDHTTEFVPSGATTGTTTALNLLALSSSIYNSPSASLYGANIMAEPGPVGGSTNFGTSVGIRGSTFANGNGGTTTNGYGVQGNVTNNGLGPVTNAYAGSFDVINTNTVTNGYGVYTGNIQATNKWSFYASDSTASNYFAGKVGIGVTSPTTPLNLLTSGTGGFQGLLMQNTTNDATNKGGFIVGARKTNANVPFATLGTWDDGSNRSISVGGSGWSLPDPTIIKFITASAYNETAGAGVERVTINPNGNVAIGVAAGVNNAVSKLDVNGGMSVGSYAGTNAAPSNGMIVSGNVGIGNSSPGTAFDLNGAFSMRGMAAPAASPAGQGRIYFDSTSNQFMVSQNAGSYAALATTGGTKSGLTSTAGQIFNSDSDGSGSDGGFNFQANGSNLMTIANNGDIALSSTTASTSGATGALTVAGGLGVNGAINSNSTITGGSISSTGSATTVYATSSSSIASPIMSSNEPNINVLNNSSTDGTSAVYGFQAKNASGLIQRAYMAAVSNTGASTYTPNIVFGQQTGATAYSERMRIDSSGNVGIGTTGPAATLDVNGTIDIKGLNGIRYPASDSTAGGSTAIGSGALATEDSLASTAFWNTAIGYNAMGSGTLTTAATVNTAVGAKALAANTSGTGNTAVGYGALVVNTSGGSNVAIGVSAMQSNTTGVQNTALGYRALLNDSTGQFNTAVGTNASVNATASGNTSIGYAAGFDITSGQNNIIIGPYSTTGVGVTTGSYNILIGSDVRPPSQTASNQLNIGNLIYATGLATGATASTGKVGIGTTGPAATLDVLSAPTGTSGSILGASQFTTNYQPGSAAASGTQVNNVYTWMNTLSTSDLSNVTALGGNYTVQHLGGSNITSAIGFQAAAIHAGTNTMTQATGGQYLVSNTSTGTLTNASGVSISGSNSGGGTITNSYGVQIGSIPATNRWGIYQTDSAAKNYFAGNVGIGTTSPAGILDVEGGTATGTNNGTNINIVAQNAHGTNMNGGNINLNPGLGSGGGNAGWLHVGNFADLMLDSGSQLTWNPSGSSAPFIQGNYLTTYLQLSASGGNDLYIKSNGSVGIGTSSPSTPLQVAGEISPSVDSTYSLGDGALRFKAVFAVNGTIQTSDRREKTDIQPSDLGLDFIRKLQPVSYRWNNGADEYLHYGLIAQDTEKAISEAKKQAGENPTDVSNVIVSHDDKTDRYGLKYTELISPLIKAVQELYNRLLGIESRQNTLDRDIASVKAENAQLKAENKALQQRLNDQQKDLEAIKRKLGL